MEETSKAMDVKMIANVNIKLNPPPPKKTKKISPNKTKTDYVDLFMNYLPKPPSPAARKLARLTPSSLSSNAHRSS